MTGNSPKAQDTKKSFDFLNLTILQSSMMPLSSPLFPASALFGSSGLPPHHLNTYVNLYASQLGHAASASASASPSPFGPNGANPFSPVFSGINNACGFAPSSSLYHGNSRLNHDVHYSYSATTSRQQQQHRLRSQTIGSYLCALCKVEEVGIEEGECVYVQEGFSVFRVVLYFYIFIVFF